MKHKAQNHGGQSLECEICQKMFKIKKDLNAHIEEKHSIVVKEHFENSCECTDDTVCDKCLEEDGWVHKQ